MSVKEFFLNLFFPKFCLFCHREGDYLCQDCTSLLEISEYHYCLCKKPLKLPKPGKCKRCKTKLLNGLYFALSYQNSFCQKLIQQFKYEPAVKELAIPLASLIISHFQFSGNNPQGEVLIPIPLTKKKMKRRGFNQSEEIAKRLSGFLNIPLIPNCLIKIKEGPPQVELLEKERMESPKGAYMVREKDKIKGKRILLVDDVYTTGSTMEEAARVLKESGAREVWGIVIARG